MKINGLRFLIATSLAFGFVAFFDFLYNSHILAPMYQESSYLWRPKAEIASYIPLETCLQLVLVCFLSLMYISLELPEGIKSGARLGFYMGTILAFSELSLFPYLPISIELAAAWFVGGFFQVLFACLIISAIYKKERL